MCKSMIHTLCFHQNWGHLQRLTQNNSKGASEIYPTKQRRGGGAQKDLAMLNGGHTQFWDNFYSGA